MINNLISILALAVISISLAIPCHADMTKTDIGLEIVYQSLHWTDYGQTNYVATTGRNQYHETNPVLGHHPHSDTVMAYFALTSIAHAGISYLLPDSWRTAWQAVTIGIEASMVTWNTHIGIGMRF